MITRTSVEAGAAPLTWVTTLPAVPESVHSARVQVRAALADLRLGEQLGYAAELLTSELVTNAIRYGSGARDFVGLTVRRRGPRIRIEVRDSVRRLPRPRRAEVSDEHGRGLGILETLSTAWGARPTLTGKVVWFELTISTRGTTAREAGAGRLTRARLVSKALLVLPGAILIGWLLTWLVL